MEYSKAKRIRKTGLFKLIAQKKFEEGQGLGSSIGGAISDKFKAKATGFKEAFDPLNMTRKLFGKGLIGDVAVTGLGRLFGRKESDIDYFGGFKRKTKKNPNFSSITPGVIRPLKFGDSVADILGKMYNFMLKTDEKKKVNDEIEAAFRQEQIDEDERRHQELIKVVKKFTGKKATATKDSKDTDDITGILGILKKLFIGEIAAWASGLLESIWSAIKFVAGILEVFKALLPKKPPAPGRVSRGKTDKANAPKKVTKSVTKEGKTVYKDEKGRFASKPTKPRPKVSRTRNLMESDINVYNFDPKSTMSYFQDLLKEAKKDPNYEPYREEISKFVNASRNKDGKIPEEIQKQISDLPKDYIDPNAKFYGDPDQIKRFSEKVFGVNIEKQIGRAHV